MPKRKIFRQGFLPFASVIAAMTVIASAMPALAETITLVERATTDGTVDTNDKGDTAGDILVFSNEVFDEANTAKVGTDNGWCVRTVVGTAWECFWTTSLDGGQITVEGPFLDGKDSTLAVTGGTGKYSGAKGEMVLHSRNAEGSEYDFKFNLTQ